MGIMGLLLRCYGLGGQGLGDLGAFTGQGNNKVVVKGLGIKGLGNRVSWAQGLGDLGAISGQVNNELLVKGLGIRAQGIGDLAVNDFRVQG